MAGQALSPSTIGTVTLARPVATDLSPVYRRARDQLRSQLVVRGYDVREVQDQEALRTALCTSDAALVHPPLRVGEDDLTAFDGRLKVVATAGAGFDHLDVDALRRRGIHVVSGGGETATTAVAEHTIAMMFALTKRVVQGHAAVVEENFGARWIFERHSIVGQTIGVVGFGRIGQRVAAMCHHGLSMRVIYWTHDSGRATGPSDHFVRASSLLELAHEADVVSLHVPLTTATRHLVSDSVIRQMKPGALLINTSRGEIVDQTALERALVGGRLGGAGLDVFEGEPPTLSPSLRDSANVVLSPHCAGITVEAVAAMSSEAAEKIDAALRRSHTLITTNAESGELDQTNPSTVVHQ